MEKLPKSSDSSSLSQSPLRVKPLLQKAITLSPLLACSLIAGFYVLDWAWNIGSFSSLLKKSQIADAHDCTVPFWEAFIKTTSMLGTLISANKLSEIIPIELSSGALSIIALIELIGIFLQIGFIIDPIYQGISYVFTILAGGLNNYKREFISKIFQNAFFRAFLLLPGSFSNFAIGTWLQINTVESYSCLGSDLRQSSIDAVLIWMYLINSLFRAIIVVYMVIGFLLGPIFGIRKPFASPAEELEEFFKFYHDNLARELIANQNLKFITFRSAVFDFTLTYQKNFAIKFHCSGKVVSVNLIDVISNNMSVATMQFEIESQYAKEQSTETKTQRRLALIYLIFQAFILALGFISGVYLFVFTLIYHKKSLKAVVLALAFLVPALLNFFLAMSAVKGKNGNKPRSGLSRVTPLSGKSSQYNDDRNLEPDKFSIGSKEKSHNLKGSEGGSLVQEKSELITSNHGHILQMEPSTMAAKNDLISAFRLFYKTELAIPIDKVNALQKTSAFPSKNQLSITKRKVANSPNQFFEKSDATPVIESLDVNSVIEKDQLSNKDSKSSKRTPKILSNRFRNQRQSSLESASILSKSEESDQDFEEDTKIHFVQKDLEFKSRPKKVKVFPKRL